MCQHLPQNQEHKKGHPLFLTEKFMGEKFMGVLFIFLMVKIFITSIIRAATFKFVGMNEHPREGFMYVFLFLWSFL